ncbi:MAG: hypothetical protein H6577_05645 [Lewinellaceae bacterium]|nr:hypothetical protein [Lewinellaceae bacterium]
MEKLLLIEYQNKNDVSQLMKDDEILFKDVSSQKQMLEWITLSLLTIYVIKPFTDAFFKEAGKEFYALLKKVFKSLFKKKNQGKSILLRINKNNVNIQFRISIKEEIVDDLIASIKDNLDSKKIEREIENRNLNIGDTLELEYIPETNSWTFKKENDDI